MNGTDIAKMLIGFGLLLVAAGAVFFVVSKLGINLGRLPGDINIKKDNFSFHFPIVTSIIVSIILSVLLNLFFRK